MLIRTRREFFRETLRSAGALTAASAMAKFGEINALAAGGGYQALVCIYLAGGNDGHNTVIPIQTAQQNYGLYQTGRQTLALPQGSLLPIHNGNDVYGLHSKLPEIQALYNAGKAAVLANVGMLVAPLDRNAYTHGAAVPSALFSHSDQSSQWQSAVPTGIASTGWGGRLIDALQSQNAGSTFPPITTTSSCGLFCTGQQNFPAVVPPAGTPILNGLQGSTSRAQAMQTLLSFDNGLQLVQAANGILARGAGYANTLSALLANAKVNTPFPQNNPLAAQLQTVARIMTLRNQLGLNRQIFFCQLGGFDTHGSQLATQDQLLQQLSQAVGAFYTATQELSIDNAVTTFTTSEFGRTLTPNSNAGTDHAWGSHHFIIGTGVTGGAMYGNFPSLALGSQYDANSRGTLIPTTSVDQYGATLAKWFGVSSGMSSIFPNIGNFGAQPTLSFLG